MCGRVRKGKRVEAFGDMWIDGYYVGAVIYAKRYRPLPEFAT